MNPEILIVGDESRRVELARRVRTMGYEADACDRSDVGDRLKEARAPAAIIVCGTDGDTPLLMAELRRNPHGAAVPVTLCGRLGEQVRDLADVLDLGADHFLEEPVGDDQLQATLEALAGPAPVLEAPDSAPRHAGPPDAVGEEVFPTRTEIIAEPDPVPPRGTATLRPGAAADPVIGQLHRTLDLLEERLRSRKDRSPGDSADDMELDALGIDAVPDVDADAQDMDPATGGERLGNVESSASRPVVGPRESTVLLENASPPVDAPSVVPPPVQWGSSASLGGRTTKHRPEPAPLIHDRPRRAVPLPVDNEGSLESIEVPRLMWKLHRARFSGRVQLVRGRVEKSVWFDNGAIVFARSNVGHDRLIDGLLRRGLLTRRQYDTARRLASKQPRRAGQLLVEAGFLKAEELPRVIRNHLMRIVDSTFPWNEGRWTLAPDEGSGEAIVLDSSTALVIVEGIRSRMEAPQLWALLGGLQQFPRLRPDAAQGREAEIAEALLMSPTEEAWLPKLDGKRSLEELTVDRSVDELELLALVYGLHVLELVELVGEPQAVPKVSKDPASLDRERIEARLRLAREADYFALLGLNRDATRVDVRRAFSELKETFADEALEAHTRRELEGSIRELRQALDEAHAILIDDAMRNAYLAHLEEP